MAFAEDEVRARLLDFYAGRFPSRRGISIPDFAKVSDGWENDVYSFAVDYEEDGERECEELILRVYPGDNASRKAFREFNGMRKLHELGYPVPEVFILEVNDSPFGKPFVIMERINGRSMGKILDESPDEKLPELIRLFLRMFVDLHNLDWRPFALDSAICEAGDPYASVTRWLAKVQWYVDRFRMDGFAPAVDWLRERSSDVSCERPSVIHFDYHPNNILMRDDGKAFVIDWTNIDVADFRFDLAWTILLTSTYGYPEAREMVLSGYERIAGKRIEQIRYFEVAASLRRLFSIAASLSDGADKLGMRPEAAAMMKQNVKHIENLHLFLYERTGITVPEIESLLSGLS